MPCGYGCSLVIIDSFFENFYLTLMGWTVWFTLRDFSWVRSLVSVKTSVNSFMSSESWDQLLSSVLIRPFDSFVIWTFWIILCYFFLLTSILMGTGRIIRSYLLDYSLLTLFWEAPYKRLFLISCHSYLSFLADNLAGFFLLAEEKLWVSFIFLPIKS